ncbi:MAG: hypothetical protein CMM41_12510 [Rhodospirillaceae bacterium]|nr:hypothetical protein [Rhodospirillaceae bacterium]
MTLQIIEYRLFYFGIFFPTKKLLGLEKFLKRDIGNDMNVTHPTDIEIQGKIRFVWHTFVMLCSVIFIIIACSAWSALGFYPENSSKLQWPTPFTSNDAFSSETQSIKIAQSTSSENVLRTLDFFLGLIQRKSNLNPLPSSRCSNTLNTEGLLQRSWINEAKQFLRGRQTLFYHFNKSTNRIVFRHEGQNYALSPRRITETDAREAQKLLYQLDQLISLDFRRTYYKNNADLLVYLICEPDAHYGEVIDDPSGTKQIMFLNECAEVAGKHNRMDYKFLHEMGHVLGLEHPFDGDDGDCIFTTAKFSSDSAHLGQTLMAYREPPFGTIPGFYTSLDIRALIEAWGPE